MEVAFKFSLNQKVVIEDRKIEGKVSGLLIDRDRIQWADVRYVFADTGIKSEWVREEDLAAVDAQSG